MTDDLMTLDDIASLYRCSRRHARDCITKHPKFPQIVPGASRRLQLWLREDVVSFMTRGQPRAAIDAARREE